jgi:hypothetical protein
MTNDMICRMQMYLLRNDRRRSIPTLRGGKHHIWTWVRHTNASPALEAGVEMKVVSDRLGHSQISVTADLYTHVSRSLGNAAAEQIAGVLRAPSETVPTASLAQIPGNDPGKSGEADVPP